MIQEFLKSWTLMQESYLVGWLALLVLSMIGVLVVARDQIFMGAAVSQASTLGVALALSLSALPGFHGIEWLESPVFLSVCAVSFSVLAAVLTSRGDSAGRDTREAITGWVFLFSSSLAVLVVSHSPHGMEEVHLLMSSGIYGATWGEVWMFAGLVLVVGVFLLTVRTRALLLLTDEEMARAVGLWTGAWRLGMSCLLGLVVGLSLRCVGTLYVFGCLVLPCLAARNLCRRTFPMLVVGPAVGLVTGVVAFVLANYWDQPPGQMTIALLCLVVAATSAWRRFVRRG